MCSSWILQIHTDEEGMEIWDDSDEDSLVGARPENSTPTHYNILLRAVVAFLIMWQFHFGISEAGVGAIVLFLHHFFRLMGKLWKHQELKQMAEVFPVTFRGLCKFLGLDKLPIQKYIVCSKCHSLYDYNSCILKRPNGELDSRRCEFVRYPNHSHQARRKPCGELLMKVVRTEFGRNLLKPKKLYCYRPLQDSIQQFLQRNGFVQKCELWRKRVVESNMLLDVFDGNLWKEYQVINGQPYLSLPYNYVVALNVDWFKPFSHSKYSLGAIYLVVLNLPREERFKVENVILVGLIPGPREPHLVINSYLYPLVKELKAFQNGIKLQVPSNSLVHGVQQVTVKVVLGPVICDIPASRKTCGFMGHSARLGCSKCLKQFQAQTFGDSLDYSGYDVANWPLRNIRDHRAHAAEHCIRSSESKAAERRTEQLYGCRYSVLLELPYFDIVKHNLIDPMHNLLLGTGKYIFGLWVDKKILTPEKVREIEHRIQQFCVPYNIGRLPVRIEEGLSNLKADQMRNWIVVYSIVCLKDLIPEADMECWRLFVRACCLLLTRLLKKTDLEVAHCLLLNFCCTYQELYGPQYCTPNMHLHMHLQQCLRDCGPVYSIWCFSFERFNGLLESFYTNQKEIELQVMKKFIYKQLVQHMDIDKDFQSLLSPLESRQNEDYMYNPSDDLPKICKIYAPECDPEEMAFAGVTLVKPSNPRYEKTLDEGVVKLLNQVYATLYPMSELLHASHFCQLSQQVTLAGDTLASLRSRGERSPMVIAHWYCLQHVCCLHCNTATAGIVQHYFIHKAEFRLQTGKVVTATHVFAKVHWLKAHALKDHYGMPITVWSTQSEPSSAAMFIPVLRIACTSAYMKTVLHFPPLAIEDVYLTVPVMKNNHFVM